MLEAPEVEGHLHHKTGHNLTDKILAVSAIFLSGMSVFIAVHHGQTMERLVAANTWPNISFSTGNESDDHLRHDVTLKLKNTGVGPGLIDTFEVFYEGAPFSNALGFAESVARGRESNHQPGAERGFIPRARATSLSTYQRTATVSRPGRMQTVNG